MKYLNFKILLGILLMYSCGTTKDAHNTGKYQRKLAQDGRIASDKIGINIQLFDIENRKEISMDNVKNLPVHVIDSSANSKLHDFNKDSVPNIIFMTKPTKTLFLLPPEKHKIVIRCFGPSRSLK